MQVIHELDEKKDHARLGERAKRVISEIKKIRAAGGQVRKGVRLEIFNYELASAELPETNCADDRIIRLLKAYSAKNPDAQASVCTEDTGMQLRCEATSTSCVEVNNSWRLADPKSELENKHREVVAELNRLKHKMPILKPAINASGEGSYPPTYSFARPAIFEGCDGAVEAERRRLMLKPPSQQDNLALQLDQLIDTSEYVRYDRDLEKYLDEYREYLSDKAAALDKAARVFRFSLTLSNVGKAPATDIEVRIKFPPCLRFVAMAGSGESIGDVPKPTGRPCPPTKPQSMLQKMTAAATAEKSLSLFRNMHRFNPPYIPSRGEPVSNLAGNARDGFEIISNLPRLVHHRDEEIESFDLMLTSWDNVKPFEVEWRLTAAELPEAKVGKIPFVLRVQE